MRKPYHIRERSPGHWAIIFSHREPASGQAQTPMALLQGDEEGSPD
jgi:hypothetical protein